MLPDSPPTTPQLNKPLLRRLMPLARLLGDHYFGADVRGLDRLPDGPALIVGNHNAGLMSPEIITFYGALTGHHGLDALPVGLAHTMVFKVPGLARMVAAGRGIVADPENAVSALQSDYQVLVFPGGDWEAMRPSRHRDHLDFNGRTGFVKTALRADVPVVPLVTAGAHDGWYVLSRGNWLARLLKLDDLFRINVFPLGFALPTGVIPGPAAIHIPMPTDIRIEVGDPIDLDGDPDDPEDVRRGYDLVTWTMQERLTELADEIR